MKTIDSLLAANQIWATEKIAADPEYFKRLSQNQKPDILWIGCSDSRVPAEVIVNAEPGDIFVHRNIANQVISTDFNGLSVLQYAVKVLKVSHIIVCGHYNCGGVKAALNKQSGDLLITNKWLMHIKDVYRLHKDEIESLPTEMDRINRLVELNVIEQVSRLAHTSIIQHAWQDSQQPTIHGCVYSLHDGLIKKLISMDETTLVDSIYEYDFN